MCTTAVGGNVLVRIPVELLFHFRTDELEDPAIVGGREPGIAGHRLVESEVSDRAVPLQFCGMSRIHVEFSFQMLTMDENVGAGRTTRLTSWSSPLAGRGRCR